jgi:hypothetical protein
MRNCPEPSPQGGRIWSRKTHGASEPLQQVRSHDTRGDVGAILIREASFGAAGPPRMRDRV